MVLLPYKEKHCEQSFLIPAVRRKICGEGSFRFFIATISHRTACILFSCQILKSSLLQSCSLLSMLHGDRENLSILKGNLCPLGRGCLTVTIQNSRCNLSSIKLQWHVARGSTVLETQPLFPYWLWRVRVLDRGLEEECPLESSRNPNLLGMRSLQGHHFQVLVLADTAAFLNSQEPTPVIL